MSRVFPFFPFFAAAVAGCSATESPSPVDGATPDTGYGSDGRPDGPADVSVEARTDANADTSAEPDAEEGSGPGLEPEAGPPDDSPPPRVETFCELPGSLRYTGAGMPTVVPGGTGESKLKDLQFPAGFCAHYFGNVGNARQLRFAPNGDLFVASPTKSTTGGGANGRSAIVILPDDNKDGIAEAAVTFLGSIVATQGILFANDHFYYQDDYRILRVPYRDGDRAPSGASEPVADLHFTGTSGWYTSALHWVKTLDQADDGTIYVANGSDQDEICDLARPFRGGVLKLDGSTAGKAVSKGFRNPTAIRCAHGHNLCFAAELAKDYSGSQGGREKLVPIRDGDDWGFPCCATKNVPHTGPEVPQRPDCSRITPDDVSFFIGDTPFGFDFEPGRWNAPYTGAVFVALHGAAGSWTGVRIVVVAIDPGTGLPKPGSSTTGMSSGAMADFVTGYDDGSHLHGRPSSIEFAKDGRMFVGNDNNGDIFWVAPLDLKR